MRFDVVRVRVAPTASGTRPVHWQAWPLDHEAARVGLWPLGPGALCGRRGVMFDPWNQGLQCETCAITACLMTNAVRVFDRYRARLLAGRQVKESA